MKKIVHSHGILHYVYLIEEPIDIALIRLSIGADVKFILIEGEVVFGTQSNVRIFYTRESAERRILRILYIFDHNITLKKLRDQELF